MGGYLILIYFIFFSFTNLSLHIANISPSSNTCARSLVTPWSSAHFISCTDRNFRGACDRGCPAEGSASGRRRGGGASGARVHDAARLCAGTWGGSPARPRNARVVETFSGAAHRLSVSRGGHRALTGLLFPEFGSDMAVPPAKMASVLNSPLWKPVFRHQLSPELGSAASWPTPPCQDSKEVSALAASFSLEWSLWADGFRFRHEPLGLRPHPTQRLAPGRQGPSLIQVVSTPSALGAGESCRGCSGNLLTELLTKPAECVSSSC